MGWGVNPGVCPVGKPHDVKEIRRADKAGCNRVECRDEHVMDDTEVALIRHYRPQFNIDGNGRRRSRRVSRAQGELFGDMAPNPVVN